MQRSRGAKSGLNRHSAVVPLQTFEVLKAVGKHHTMSAGLVIGGKDLRDEQRLINSMMILVKPQHLSPVISPFEQLVPRALAGCTSAVVPKCSGPTAGFSMRLCTSSA